jgi:PAS domain S-box-containing protein
MHYVPTQQDLPDGSSPESDLADVQRQLIDARRRLNLTLEAAGAAGSWRWDITRQRLTADARFAALTGQDALDLAEGVPTSCFFNGIHPEDVARVRIAVAGILAGAAVFSKEYRLLREDGGSRWIHAEGRAVLDDADQPVAFSGTLVDVTARKRTEDQLRVAQTAGQVGTFEYVDGSATVSVSHQFCRLVGLHPTSTLPVRTINLLVHPEDRPLIDRTWTTKPRLERNIEFRITRADTGETRWLARRGEYVQDLEATGLRYIGVIYDITESKRIEERLRLANEALSESVRERTRERNQVWQNSRDLLTIVDADGAIRDVNPAWSAILGFEPADLLGRPFVELVKDEDRERARQLISHQLEEPHEAVEFELMASDGSPRWFSWSATAEGNLIYAYGRHITAERRQAEILRETEDLLRQSQKMEAVGQLTGGIAHDFNNMLTGVIGSLDVMKRRIAARRYDELGQFMEAAISSAERAAALIHRLLAFSRRQSLDRKPIDVIGLIASMRDLLDRTLGEQIKLDIVLPQYCWHAVTDANELESAVLNLVINARDAMPNGGRLTIEVKNASLADRRTARADDLASGDYVVVCVADNGEGMAPEVIEKAFDPFFTTKPIGQGTGLGLSMVYGFARQSGGHVKIASSPGQGTSVYLYLPRNTAPVQVAAPITAVATPRGQGETVVIVEDDASVRLLVVAVLEELGYRAVEASDGNQALPILQSSMQVDLLISDVGLPGLNGRQLADIVRQTRPDLPVLFMTGYAAMAASRADFLAPAMDMIAKPFAVEVLANKIQSMLASSVR